MAGDADAVNGRGGWGGYFFGKFLSSPKMPLISLGLGRKGRMGRIFVNLAPRKKKEQQQLPYIKRRYMMSLGAEVEFYPPHRPLTPRG